MKALALITILVLTSCGTVQENRIRQNVLSDPNLSPELRQVIANKKIRVGMTKEQVLAAWGRPCGWCYGTRQSSSGDSWEYNIFGTGYYGAGSGTYLYFDRNGILQHWSK